MAIWRLFTKKKAANTRGLLFEPALLPNES
jgi:hypothetical protein